MRFATIYDMILGHFPFQKENLELQKNCMSANER